VLYYLHHHRDLGLRYSPDQARLSGMTDSDWAVKHSTTGFVFMFSRACVSWGCKKQTSVALSSCEAELMAASESAKEAVYLQEFLSELGEVFDAPIELAMDNTGGIDLAYNPEHHQRTKHIQRRHFFLRELVEEHRLTVPYVNTVDNLADFFTKALKPATFFLLRDRIMNVRPRTGDAATAPARRSGGHSRPADCSACGDAGAVKGEPCYVCDAHA
jgi:hypothetical protein